MISLKQFAQMRLRKRIIKQLIKMPGAYKFCHVEIEDGCTYHPKINCLARCIEKYILYGMILPGEEQSDSK